MALSIAVLLTCAGLVEVVLRTTHLFGARLAWVEPDRVIGWRFTPDRDYWFFKENDHAITGRINSHGWRDRERDAVPAQGKYRVAVIGDSFVEAFQVELDSTFAAIAERELNADGAGSVEVMNFGRSGFTQTEEYLLLDPEVFSFEPDAVVFVFVPANDIADVSPRTASNTTRPFPISRDGEITFDFGFRDSRAFRSRVRINWLKQHSALVSLVAERYNAARRAAPAPGESGDTLVRHLSLWTARPDSLYRENLELCRRLTAMAAQACERRGVDFLLVGLSLAYTDEQIASCRALDSTFDPDGMDRDLEEWAREGGYDYRGLQGPFRADFERYGKPLYWAHWNYRGHRVVSEVLSDWIRDRQR